MEVTNEIILYQSTKGDIKLDVTLQGETVWLTQEQMSRLFGKGRSTITEHISNIFKEGELVEEVWIFSTFGNQFCVQCDSMFVHLRQCSSRAT